MGISQPPRVDYAAFRQELRRLEMGPEDKAA